MFVGIKQRRCKVVPDQSALLTNFVTFVQTPSVSPCFQLLCKAKLSGCCLQLHIYHIAIWLMPIFSSYSWQEGDCNISQNIKLHAVWNSSPLNLERTRTKFCSPSAVQSISVPFSVLFWFYCHWLYCSESFSALAAAFREKDLNSLYLPSTEWQPADAQTGSFSSSAARHFSEDLVKTQTELGSLDCKSCDWSALAACFLL